MRILVVEDDRVLADALVDRITREIDAVVTRAESLGEAQRSIEAETFDAAIVDLRIPSEQDAGDASVAFGKAAEATLAGSQPGTLRVFLTASDAGQVVDELSAGGSGDFFLCDDPFGLVKYFPKTGIDGLDQCVSCLRQHAIRLASLDSVELSGADELNIDSRRALALTVRRVGATQGRVLRQSGLSAATTALLECFDGNGNLVGNAFCKSGPPEEIERELRGYDLARFQLPSTNFPMLSEVLDTGIGRTRALVFTQAPSTTTFFAQLDADDSAAATVAGRLSTVLAAWRQTADRSIRKLDQLIADEITDEVAANHAAGLTGLGLHDLDSLEIDLLSYVQHGDLHGANLFVTDALDPFLIDFEQTGIKPGPADAVSLELSVLFHPESPLHGAPPSAEQLTAWLSPDAAAAMPGVGPISAACRDWAHGAGHSEAEYAAATLLYCLWILNHTDQPETALSIARSAVQQLKG